MSSTDRRTFLRVAALSFLAVPLLKSHKVFAAVACPQEQPTDAKVLKKLLDPAGKKAKSLQYVVNAVDAKDNKKYKAGSTCGNCKFYKAKKEVGNYSTCAMAGNKYVPSCGWCKTYKLDKKKKA
jgi:hypothetical protein